MSSKALAAFRRSSIAMFDGSRGFINTPRQFFRLFLIKHEQLDCPLKNGAIVAALTDHEKRYFCQILRLTSNIGRLNNQIHAFKL